MSVFDEIRERCSHCGGRINHWEQSSIDYHESSKCLQQEQPDVREKSRITRRREDELSQKLIKENALKSKSDYLLDLDITLADI